MGDKEFSVEYATCLVGKTIASVEYSDYDEGYTIIFTDGSVMDFGFSGCEGEITITDTQEI